MAIHHDVPLLNKIARRLNERPRQTLDFETPTKAIITFGDLLEDLIEAMND
jgi:IS30 family transposase